MNREAPREVFRGRVFRVEVIPTAGGEYAVARHLGAVGIVALAPDGEVLLVRQDRPAVGTTTLEIPAGVLDRPGEDALSCATRELMEETGYRAIEPRFLGQFYASPGFTDETHQLFVCRTTNNPEGDIEAGIEVVRMPFDRALRAAREGKVRDAKTALGLLLAGVATELGEASA